MQPFVTMDKAFNIPCIIYDKGSYFGDNDVLGLKTSSRSHTALCREDCLIYTLKLEDLVAQFGDYRKIENLMRTIATEK